MNTTKQKLRSLELYLSAHPDNEENSECADRLSDVEEMIDNEFALIKRNEELEAMLEKVIEINKHHNFNGHLVNDQITELLNKPK